MLFERLLFTTLSLVLVIGCECGPSTKLGEIDLAPVSREMVPYTGTETLVFIDQDSMMHQLRSLTGWEEKEVNMQVRVQCEEGFLDVQADYYKTQIAEISFIDASGGPAFYCALSTFFEDAPNLDDIAIYDDLNVYSGLLGNYYGDISILASEQQGVVSSAHKEEVLQHSLFIGDTTLYNRNFQEVYQTINGGERAIFYNRYEGVVAFKIDEEAFWVLDR
ncbi:MAG: hypothetical protein AAGI38_11345 [Bacteroidota bacterium]